jgi:hypothetical protein
MPDGPTDGDREAVRDALSVLAHDIRLDIVLALLEGWAGVHTEPRRYSELMDAVGMEDSGKFNYHLDRLRGVYVEKVDGGYVPTAGATALYRAVLAHRPTEETTRTDELDESCPVCGEDLVERYERSFLTLTCPDCDWPGVTYSFPVNGLRGRTGDEHRRALENRTAHHLGLARTGQCPYCAGLVAVTFDHSADWTGDTGPSAVELSCETCTWEVVVGALVPLQFEPRVTAALSTVGVDSLPVDSQVETSASRSIDPFRLELRVETDEGTVTVVADDELNVHAVETDAGG